MQAEILLDQPRSKGDRALPSLHEPGLRLHRKRPAIQKPICFWSGRPAICWPPATAASSSPTALLARDIWRASRSPIWRRSTAWWNCTSSQATHAKLAEYERRQKITRDSLPQLLTPAGYFVKSLEPGGIKHGVLGQAQFGYLEGVANADAVALRVVDDATARSIYRQIAAFPAIRPFDFLLTNAPGLDDTYVNYGKAEPMDGFFKFGDWVNGGCWGTVEGRAILAYYRLGKFEDVRRSAERAMKWVKDFRMDAPWSQCGENTKNPWSDTGQHRFGGVAVMIDNFAIPMATLRGLFDYEYRSDRLILRPRVPGSITEYAQKQPVRFGEKKLYLVCRNGGPKVKSVAVDGKPLTVESPDAAVLRYDELPKEAKVEIVTDGG